MRFPMEGEAEDSPCSFGSGDITHVQVVVDFSSGISEVDAGAVRTFMYIFI